MIPNLGAAVVPDLGAAVVPDLGAAVVPGQSSAVSGPGAACAGRALVPMAR